MKLKQATAVYILTLIIGLPAAVTADPVEIYLVPHFHWDLAYKQKESTYHTITTAIIDDFLIEAESDPDFKFVLDQVSMIKNYMEERPSKVEQLKQLIRDGRLEITGAMYVQPDVNLPSGESLIRQIMYGQRWLEENLDTRAKYLWNIDSFGHLYQIPQIAAGAGLEATVWSYHRTNINVPEKTIYKWRSPDGSVIRSQGLHPHYNACEKLGRYDQYNREQEWKLAQELVDTLLAFEKRDRYIALCGSDFMTSPPTITELARDWNENHDDVKLIVAVPSEFFEADSAAMQDAEILDNTDYQVSWNGFLSNIIEDKLKNRAYENLLRQAEAVLTFAAFHGMDYPRKKLEALWIALLENQFHDLAAGTTIEEGRINLEKRFDFVGKRAPALIREGAEYISAKIDTASGAPADATKALVLFNTLSFRREAIVRIDADTEAPFRILTRDGGEIVYQRAGREAIFITGLPPMGWTTVYIAPGAPRSFDPGEKETQKAPAAAEMFSPSHGKFSVSIDSQNNIVSLTAGPGGAELADTANPLNQLCLQPDTGDTYNYAPVASRDFEPTPERTCTGGERFFTSGTISRGPLMDRITVSGAFGSSAISREARIYRDIPRVDFITRVDWHEIDRDIHAVFPLAAGKTRTDSVPLGFIARTENGRFPIQDWADYGDSDSGLSMLVRGLSDLYLKDGTFYLGLIRSVSRIHSTPMYAARSEGEHTLRYSLAPRDSGLFTGRDPFRMGQDFNDDVPVIQTALHPGELPSEISFLETPDGVAATAFFMDGENTAFRLLETTGNNNSAAILLSLPGITTVESVDLILNSPAPAESDLKALSAAFAPQKSMTFIAR